MAAQLVLVREPALEQAQAAEPPPAQGLAPERAHVLGMEVVSRAIAVMAVVGKVAVAGWAVVVKAQQR